eukprot:SM003711S13714  [mRNA]  locus=s3711:270:1384:- [translate_table: standard]
MAPLFYAMLQAGNLTTFGRYLNSTGLSDMVLRNSGGATLLAPTNDAFAQLPDSIQRTLGMPTGKFVLKQIMKFHYIPTIERVIVELGFRNDLLAISVGTLSRLRDGLAPHAAFARGSGQAPFSTSVKWRGRRGGIGVLLTHPVVASLRPVLACAQTYADLIGTTAFNTVPTLLGYPIATYSQAAIVYFIVNSTMKGPSNASDILPDLYKDRYISVQGIDRVLIPPASYLVAPPPPPNPPATPPPSPSPTGSGTSSPPPTSEAPPPSSPPSGTGTTLIASLQVAAVSAVAVLWVVCQ